MKAYKTSNSILTVTEKRTAKVTVCKMVKGD